MAASKAGDTATVLDLMTDDVAFMVPRRAPFGKEAFVAASDAIARDANLVTEQQFSRSSATGPAMAAKGTKAGYE